MPNSAGLNYIALKSANKVSVSKEEVEQENAAQLDGKSTMTTYYIISKQYDAETGESKDDYKRRVYPETIDGYIANADNFISEWVSKKADWEQLKTDLEAL